MYEKMSIITILHASVAHGTSLCTQYEENPYNHHGGMCEDGLTKGQMDWQTGPYPIFPNSAYANQGIITWFTLAVHTKILDVPYM